ncbi:GNAT family N-acetyltransferase [Actibacterium ureilyticum]|uniref:GNAT family N-acetyltransferase n=1 Tax=Actibacterium ureilyticum TaxID=1590614 RepID=UPI000BAABE29|nr:GNAT family N-acetyltransferase [Actibacterium ureilyticum]
MGWVVRPMTGEDVPAARAIMNDIIAAGGTTAYELPFDDAGFAAEHLGDTMVACHVVVDDAGQVAGFQWLGRHPGMAAEGAVISSFTRRDPPARGAGRALFQATEAAARAAGVAWIQARIRADNAPGLGYYSAMGFRDHDVTPGVPLRDGTPVDRVCKMFTL